jgi:hypothetical protein
VTQLNEHVQRHLPRCLSAVTATPLPVDDAAYVSTAFLLSQKTTGDTRAQVLGYPLSDYNPACSGDPDFISPLTLRWTDGNEDTVFDSDQHGYHGEMDASAKYHGEGSPQPFKCGKCGNSTFAVSVRFDYWDACEDLLEDDPEIAVQDYFCNIIFSGKCSACVSDCEILNMDL